MTSDLKSLQLILDEGFDKRAWHGPNLMGGLRGLSLGQLLYRPRKKSHNIWELAVHCAYWKYAVRNLLQEGKRRSFPLEGGNFFPRNGPLTESEWKKDFALVKREHAALKAAIRSLDPKTLDLKPKRSRDTARRLVLGIAAHDIYHAGQIALLKRLP